MTKRTEVEGAFERTEALPVFEEVATVSTRDVVTGRLRVSTHTDTVTEMARSVLDGEDVDVTRVPVGTPVDAAPPVRTEGDVTIIPVLEEVLVVEKRLVLKEEVHVRRRATRDVIETPVTLRRQRVVVERTDDAGHAANEEDKP